MINMSSGVCFLVKIKKVFSVLGPGLIICVSNDYSSAIANYFISKSAVRIILRKEQKGEFLN